MRLSYESKVEAVLLHSSFVRVRSRVGGPVSIGVIVCRRELGMSSVGGHGLLQRDVIELGTSLRRSLPWRERVSIPHHGLVVLRIPRRRRVGIIRNGRSKLLVGVCNHLPSSHPRTSVIVRAKYSLMVVQDPSFTFRLLVWISVGNEPVLSIGGILLGLQRCV